MATTSLNDCDAAAPSSPKRMVYLPQLPDSPEEFDRFYPNSDDIQPTSNFQMPSAQDLFFQERHHQNCQNLVIVGSYDKTITLGRGGASTIKIGRRNRQISRIHISISHNKETGKFELAVLGLNGACVDGTPVEQNKIAILKNNSLVDVIGDQFTFTVPPLPAANKTAEKLEAEEKEDNQKIQCSSLTDVKKPFEEQQLTKEISLNVNTAEKTDEEAEKAEPIEQPTKQSNHTEILALEDKLSLAEETKLVSKPLKVKPVKNEVKITQREDKTALQENLQIEHEDIDNNDYSEVIIDALVFSRTSSMPISDICSRILKANPVYASQPRQVWIERIRQVLKEKPFFGEIQRKGKTADGSPTENLYYYNSELDPIEWRRATYTQVGRSARKCTLKDKQYFWKIPPKLGRHRNSYIPPPALANDSKRQRPMEEDNENVDPKKTKL